MPNKLEIATLAGGCFWCTEAIFKRLDGVISVVPGYAGGKVENPTYEQVCSGTTGHAESIQIEFDPTKISFAKILAIFWQTHDPTTINQQGNDIGPQYRSAIFYHSQEQKEVAEKLKTTKMVTTIEPFTTFYPAEDYHKNYFANHKNAPYCRLVIDPKIHKLEGLAKSEGVSLNSGSFKF